MAANTADVPTTSIARVDQLVAAARAIKAKVADCWCATLSEDGGVNVRVVEPIPGVSGQEDWTLWFVTRRSSRKAADIRRSDRLSLGYQHHPDRAYVTLIGRAALIEDKDEIRSRWIEGWRLHFPGGPDDPDIVFVKVDVDRIELCVQGVTPEPFGTRHSAVARDAQRRWTVVSD